MAETENPPAWRPRVIATFATSLDGKVSTRSQEPSLFTSPRDKRHLLEVRAQGDAVMVGRKTLETDTMSLTLPEGSLTEARQLRGQAAQPFRIIVSGSGSLSPELKVFKSQGGPIVLATASEASGEALEQLEKSVAIWRISSRPLDLAVLLRRLKEELRVQTLVCEGGPGLFRSLVREDLVDELHLTLAPILFGGMGAPTLTGFPGDYFEWPVRFSLVSARLEEGEVFAHYRRERG